MDEAEKWLKENDPEYHRKEKLEYAYLSNRVMRKKREKEIPFDPRTLPLLAGRYKVII